MYSHNCAFLLPHQVSLEMGGANTTESNPVQSHSEDTLKAEEKTDCINSTEDMEDGSVSPGPTPKTEEKTTDTEAYRQKPPSLRPRKTAKKTTSQDWTHVTEQEIGMMQLPATTCRTINFKSRQTYAEKEKTKKKSGMRQKGLNNPANDGFLVKTDNISLYDGELSFKQLQKSPTALCPCPEDHVIRVVEMKHDLPLACPTCWSVQRN